MRRKLRDNGLTLTLLLLFGLTLIGQTVTGQHVYNEDQREHGQPEVGYARYLTTGHSVEALFENWESEFLQMGAYVVLTVFLFQRGSAESNDPDDPKDEGEDPEAEKAGDAPGPVKKGGLARKLYENSLSLTLFGLFAVSFVLHAAGGAREYSAEQTAHGGEAVGTAAYMGTARFWFESFQNWQSEFFSIAAIVVLSIYLRQKGSPESKPVTAPHSQTGC